MKKKQQQQQEELKSTEAKESLIRKTELCIDLLRSQLLLGFKSNEYECDFSPIIRLINSRNEMVHETL